MDVLTVIYVISALITIASAAIWVAQWVGIKAPTPRPLNGRRFYAFATCIQESALADVMSIGMHSLPEPARIAFGVFALLFALAATVVLFYDVPLLDSK